jgi:hypothetical protein
MYGTINTIRRDREMIRDINDEMLRCNSRRSKSAKVSRSQPEKKNV